MHPAGRVERPLSEGDATRLAASLYGLSAWARALPGEFDDNFRLTAADGRAFVLKAMHPARERSLVAMQCAALAQLQARVPHLALPRVVPTQAGGAFGEAPGPDGTPRLVWMLEWLPGTPLATAHPRPPETLRALGRLLGDLDRALDDFSHAAATREFPWDLARAGERRASLAAVGDPARRALAARALDRFESDVVPALPWLRRQVIHGDANDHNVIVGDARTLPRPLAGLVDFGDMHHGLLVAEPAVAAAYALLGEDDPLAAAAAVVGGYHERWPLVENEIALLLPLVMARLATSVVVSASRARGGREDPYTSVSEAPAWAALEALDRVHPRFARAVFREACGLPPIAHGPRLAGWLARADAAPVLELDLAHAPHLVVDLGIGSAFLGADPSAVETDRLSPRIFAAMAEKGAAFGVGRYGETRGIYLSPLFAPGGRPVDERRTVHLGIDLFVAAGAVVRAPLAGVVHVLANNAAPQDYGPLVILRHQSDDATPFFTLYGHLGEEALRGLAVGQAVAKGQAIATVGAPPSNGDWPPHLHFQLILDLLEQDAGFPGVALPSRRRLYEALSPDPNLLLRIPLERAPASGASAEDTLAARQRLIGPSLRLSYRRPIQAARAFRQYLYDDDGRAYLDVYNNVPLVGHSHPRVVRAVQEQLALLNTNTRYLHDLVVRYARAPHAPAAGAAARRLLRELRKRGERAGAAPRARGERSLRRDRARARLSRPHHDARGREPVQVRRARRERAARLRARGAAARRLSRPLPARRPAGRAEVRGRGAGDHAAAGGRRAPARGVPLRDAAEHGGPGGVPARLPGRRVSPRARRRRRRDRRRGADRLRPAGRGVLGLRDAGRRSGRRGDGQADRQRLPAGRGRHDARRSPTRSTTAWSSSAPSAATPSPARPGSRCWTCSRRKACRRTPAAWAARSRAVCASWPRGTA